MWYWEIWQHLWSKHTSIIQSIEYDSIQNHPKLPIFNSSYLYCLLFLLCVFIHAYVFSVKLRNNWTVSESQVCEEILNCCSQIISLDATSGGLCVSICTGNKLHIWDTRQGLLRVSEDSSLHHKIQSCYESGNFMRDQFSNMWRDFAWKQGEGNKGICCIIEAGYKIWEV
jgi:hypothetical protein